MDLRQTVEPSNERTGQIAASISVEDPSKAKPGLVAAPQALQVGGTQLPYEGTTYAPRVEGPGRPYERILLPVEANDRAGGQVLDELAQIGKRRGFTVDSQSAQVGAISSSFMWIEDPAIMFRSQDGKFSLLTSTASEADFRAARNAVMDIYGKSNAGGDFGLGKSFTDGHSIELAKEAEKAGWDVKKTPLAVDGGNLLTVTGKDGAPISLIGKNSVLVNWQMLKQGNEIDQNEIKKMVTEGKYDRTQALEFQTLAKMNGRTLGANEAAQMAAEVEYTRLQLAKTLNLPADRLVTVEQAAFHIDMETRSLGVNPKTGKPRIMVSDLNMSVDALDKAIAAEKKNPTPTPAGALSTLDSLKELREQTIAVLGGGDQAILDRKAKTLERAGFEVIRAPTNFGSSSNGDNPPVNFANGVSGTDKAGNTYFITNRPVFSSTLEKIFSDQMKAQGVDVEYVSTGALLSLKGGLDCVTKEIGTRIRKENSNHA